MTTQAEVALVVMSTMGMEQAERVTVTDGRIGLLCRNGSAMFYAYLGADRATARYVESPDAFALHALAREFDAAVARGEEV